MVDAELHEPDERAATIDPSARDGLIQNYRLSETRRQACRTPCFSRAVDGGETANGRSHSCSGPNWPDPMRQEGDLGRPAHILVGKRPPHCHLQTMRASIGAGPCPSAWMDRSLINGSFWIGAAMGALGTFCCSIRP